MGCISIFDISGIQNYLFRSSKLKENFGASLLVWEALDAKLKEAIKDKFPNEETRMLAWEENRNFSLLQPGSKVMAEILYIGGGNALVAYKADKETAVSIAEELGRTLLKEAPGIQLSVAHLKTDFSDFQKDREELFDVLLFNAKNSTVRSNPLLGLSITRQCPQTGLPATELDPDTEEWVSSEILSKRQRASQPNKFDTLLSQPEHYIFPLDLDRLGQIRGENHIAVIHLDGNNMSAFWNKLLSNKTDYLKVVPIMRQFSNEVRSRYWKTLEELIHILEGNIRKDRESYYCSGKIKLEWENDGEDQKVYLPIRPIVCNGDDVTFVTEGRLGISMAETFLRILGNKTIEIDNTAHPLSACAGIAIVKSHFPFFRAYQLAEELCVSAKQKAKHLSGTDDNIGNWLDFQILHSGVTSDLTSLRETQYTVPGLKSPSPIYHTKHAQLELPRYHLCWRPWEVFPAQDGDSYNWEELRECYKTLVSEWPRSKLKDLRNTFITGQTPVKILLKEARSRELLLPDWGSVASETGFNSNNMTPYFDALELLDFFIEIKEEERQ